MLTLWHNARLAPMDGADPERIFEDGALVVGADRILWAGPAVELPGDLRHGAAARIDLGGALVTPGLVDCHTHLVYGGERSQEFELRLRGASYEEIARAGGGIGATVAATRQCTEAELGAQAAARLRTLMAAGVTTVEIKSGYGLTRDHEARLLRVARGLGLSHAVAVRTTFLGAHALPPEFAGRPDDYIDAVCAWLPQLHAEGLVDAVDAFCDTVGFTLAQARRVLDAARILHLPVKLHAEQLSNQHGAAMAAGRGALSCDHLERLDEAGVRAMADAGTVAVLLPGAFYYLRDTTVPPIAALRAAGVPIALATDHNPGSSPVLAPLLICNMACVLFGLTPWEALRGFTANAARALGMGATHGVLAAGRQADFAVWDAGHPRELVHAIGANPCLRVVRAGVERPH